MLSTSINTPVGLDQLLSFKTIKTPQEYVQSRTMTRRNRSVRTMEGQNKRQAFLNGNVSRQPPIRQSGEFLKDSITFVTKSYKVEKP